MNILTAIFSYNSSDMTRRVYDGLNHEGHDLIIVDNSDSDDKIPDFGKVYHLGYDNIEYGGMIQWLMSNDEITSNYDFIGFLNNDIYGLGKHHIDSLHSHLNSSIGIAHWSLYPTDVHANLLKYVEGGEPSRRVGFIENIAPYYNINLIKEFKEFFPLPKYGCIDVAISDKSIAMEYNNIVINEAPFHHMRSGVRDIVGSKANYIRDYSSDTMSWNARLAEKGISYNNNMSW